MCVVMAFLRARNPCITPQFINVIKGVHTSTGINFFLNQDNLSTSTSVHLILPPYKVYKQLKGSIVQESYHISCWLGITYTSYKHLTKKCLPCYLKISPYCKLAPITFVSLPLK